MRGRRLTDSLLGGALALLLHVGVFWAVATPTPTRPTDARAELRVIHLTLAAAPRGQVSASTTADPPAQAVTAAPSQRAVKAAGAGTNGESGREGEDRVEAGPPLGGAEALRSYEEAVHAHLLGYREYPESSRRLGEQGVVQVGFALDRRGRVLDAWIERSSGFAALDTAALATVRRAQPLPAVPDALPAYIDLRVPIAFSIV